MAVRIIKKSTYEMINIILEIKFEIKEHLGTLSESVKGWTKELNLVSWNGREPKYDLRDWDLEHKKMSKGITLTARGLNKLKEVVDALGGVEV